MNAGAALVGTPISPAPAPHPCPAICAICGVLCHPGGGADGWVVSSIITVLETTKQKNLVSF